MNNNNHLSVNHLLNKSKSENNIKDISDDNNNNNNNNNHLKIPSSSSHKDQIMKKIKSDSDLIILNRYTLSRSNSFSTLLGYNNNQRRNKNNCNIKNNLSNLVIINNHKIKNLIELLRHHNFLIDCRNIKIKEQIGKGGFGVVYKGLMKIKGFEIDIAIKKIDLVSNARIEILKKIIKEVISMNFFDKYKHILQCSGVFFKGNSGYIVLEYCSEGDLYNYIILEKGKYKNRKKSKKLSQRKKINILIQICKGMYYLHTIGGIVHRDLKPSNIFITNKGIIKIGDFGESGKLFTLHKKFIDMKNKKELNSKYHRIYGTVNYVAPEILLTNSVVRYIDHKKADIYSFGMVMYFLLTETVPHSKDLNRLKEIHKNKNKNNIFHTDHFIKHFEQKFRKSKSYINTTAHFNVVKRDYHFPDILNFKGLKIEDDLIDLMTSCWDIDPNKRPKSFNDILSVLIQIRNIMEERKKKKKKLIKEIIIIYIYYLNIILITKTF